jgi:hypothetical protein
LAGGAINFNSDTFYLALYTNNATLDQTTTAYTNVGEATGGNYVAGGQVVTAVVNSSTTPSGSVTYINFSSPSWTGAITARGALIYKAGANGAICVLDFGNDKISSSTFTVQMPLDNASSALIRLV